MPFVLVSIIAFITVTLTTMSMVPTIVTVVLPPGSAKVDTETKDSDVNSTTDIAVIRRFCMIATLAMRCHSKLPILKSVKQRNYPNYNNTPTIGG